MLVLISYDVSTTSHAGRRRLRHVAKTCVNHGQRVQNSVFECLLTTEQWTRLRARLLAIYNPEEDSLRFYFLGDKWRRKIEHLGTKPSYDPEGPLIL